MRVKLTGPRADFTGVLGKVKWVNGRANVPSLSQRLASGYGVVEDKITLVEAAKASTPEVKFIVDTLKEHEGKEVFVPDNTFNISPTEDADKDVIIDASQEALVAEGAKELADIVAAKKQEIEQAASASEEEIKEDVAPTFKIDPTLKKSDIKTYEEVGNFGAYRGYLRGITGRDSKNKKAALALREELVAILPE